ncbi:MAG: flippase-like domain-containing protein, partial [Kiritimatiellae bacterium]|nr:flippase-like domain-containing protein [Kiritimatiellia bacterium]
MKTLTRLVVSAACSVLVLGMLLSLAGSLGADVSPSDVVAALRSAIPTLVAAYALCQLVQAFARAQRARILLRASLPAGTRVPGLFRMLLVTFVRGACADMLPARIGELSYVAMLNRGCAVPAADCLSSLSIGLLFDFLALLAVLAVAIPAAAQGLSLVGSILMLAAVCAVGVALLFFALPVAAAWRWERFALFRWRPVAALVKLARDVAA